MEKLQKKLFTVKIIELAVLLCMLIIGFLPMGITTGWNYGETSLFTFAYYMIKEGYYNCLPIAAYGILLLILIIVSAINFIRVIKHKNSGKVKKYYTPKPLITLYLAGVLATLIVIFANSMQVGFLFTGLIPAIVLLVVNLIAKKTNKEMIMIKLSENK